MAAAKAGRGRLARGEDGTTKARRVKWSEALGERILAKLAEGEFLYEICRQRGMPSPEGLYKWRREKPDWGARLDAARRAAGRPPGLRGTASTYCEALAEEIFRRVCEGESLTGIGKDPTMPCVWTIFRWRKERPQFDKLIHLGMRIRGERCFDVGWEMMEAATPETAYLASVQLAHVRWSAGAMAPRTFRSKPVEPEQPQKLQTILFRHFKIEKDRETGKMKVVAYCPNPVTGQPEREDMPGWRQAGDEDTLSLPGGRTTGEGYWADDYDDEDEDG